MVGKRSGNPQISLTENIHYKNSFCIQRIISANNETDNFKLKLRWTLAKGSKRKKERNGEEKKTEELFKKSFFVFNLTMRIIKVK